MGGRNNEHAAYSWWERLTVSMENETPHLQCLTEESSQDITAVLVNYTGEPLGKVESLSAL